MSLRRRAARVGEDRDLRPRARDLDGVAHGAHAQCALNRVRKQGSSGEELSSELPSAEPTPEERLLQQERRQALLSALGRLGQKERVLFYRKYYYRQSTAQIAAELGMTERAVEGRLYRIKKALRKALGGDEA